MRNFLFVVLTGLVSVVTSVDRGNFKTCSQSGFCKRQRDMNPDDAPYKILMDSVTVEETKVQMNLYNPKNDVKLKLELGALKNNMVRMRVVELDPIKDRYEPPIGDVLIAEPEKQGLTVESKDHNSVTLSFQDNKVVLQSDPFRIDVINNNELVISINSGGLLKYEHYRTQPQKDEPPPPPEENADQPEEEQPQEEKEEEKTEEEEPDMWEETFKSHKDTKPHGPSSVGVDVSFPGFEHVYGIPEHAETLALKSTKSTDPYRLYNLDVFEYELNNPMALYGSVPVMLAHNEKRTVGMFWLNAAETWIDISSNIADKNLMSKLVDFVKGGDEIPQIATHWFSESGIIDLFLMMGPTPKEVFKQYASLTGTTPLPPLFAISYHQSRWNYNDEQDVANVNAGFDEHNIPMDVIWLDIEHTDGKRYFTWDANKFPNSVGMIDNVASKGRKVVTIIDPHMKRDDNYLVYKEGHDAGYFIKNKDGNDYDGWCWPGSSGWLDFLDPKVREFWAGKFQLDQYVGSTLDLFTWNDMNEPSVFNGPEITMHKDAKHYGGWEHRDVHNLYGTYVHRATVEGQLLRSNHEHRPFVLSRAFFSGSQRYGAIWTGDNTGEWGHLKISLPMVMSLNLVGITFSGADIGGFFKNPDNELLTRWYQAAAYQPFFRAHAHLDTKRREPWLLPDRNLDIIRQAIQVRYRLLPYWYTLFYESELDGTPLVSPLWVEFPTDKSIFTKEDAHLVGSALLVHPVTDAHANNVHVYFPGQNEIWYDVDTYQGYLGGNSAYISVDLAKVPVFQRGGSIIPRRNRMRRSSSLTYNDPFTLYIALDNKSQAKGRLYIDDYHSFKYKNGQFSYREFTFSDNKLVSRSASSSGSFSTKAWLERVIIVGVKKPSSISVTDSDGVASLDFSYDDRSQLLTIRKPGSNIAKDFTIQLQ